MDVAKRIDEYIARSGSRAKENANQSFSYPGMLGYLLGFVTAEYALEHIYPKTAQELHEKCHIHIHDMSGLCCYCYGMDYEMALNQGIQGESEAPKHFETALGQMDTLIFQIAGQIAGAVAINSPDVLLAPYIKNDGLTYKQVKQCVQQFIYRINAKLRQNYEAPFSNFQLDLTVPKSLRGRNPVIAGETMDFLYDDCQQEINWFNTALIEVMMEAKRILPFPVLNMSITNDFNWDNKLAETMFKGIGSMGLPVINNYVNSDYDPDSVRSMCCFDGSQEVMIKKYGTYPEKMSFKEAHDRFFDNTRLPILHNGTWAKGQVIKVKTNGNKMYKVTTSNNKEILVTDNHLNPTFRGDIRTDELSVDDYLLFNSFPVDSRTDKKTYETGVIIGAYLGDGCKNISETTFSLSQIKVTNLEKLIATGLEHLGIDRDINIYEKDSLRSMRIYGSELPEFISEWVNGDYAYEKSLNSEVYRASTEFKQGILDGLYMTDGGNRNRIYSISKQLIDDIEAMCTTMGINTVVNIDDRVGQQVTFPDGHITTKNYPCYCIRFYELSGRRQYGNVFKLRNNQIGFKIKSIEEIECPEYVYCFQMNDTEDPYFTLPNGIITHNCSLRLDMSKIMKSNGSFGANNNSGSIGVVTINLALMGHLADGDIDILKAHIKSNMEVAAEVLGNKRAFIEDWHKLGMYPRLQQFIDDFHSFFSTIGIGGMNEMCLNFLGKGIDTEEGTQLAEEILDYMNEVLGELQVQSKHWYNGKGVYWNLEATPLEGATRRLAQGMHKYYPEAMTSNGTNQDYITRGTLLPVDVQYTLKFACEHQERLQSKLSGGANFAHYLEAPIEDWKVTRGIVKRIVNNTTLPFISISPIVNICPLCHQRITGDTCEHNVSEYELEELRKQGIEYKEVIQ